MPPRKLPPRRRRKDPTPEVPAELKAEHKHFILEYLANGYNATAAYAQAYPNAKRSTAGVEGFRLLKDPRIKAVIEKEERARWRRRKMDGDEALALISDIARADIRDCFDEQGQLLPVAHWPKRIRLCVRSVTKDRVVLYDAQRAREVMATHSGKLKPEATGGASLATLAQLLTGQYEE